MRIVQGHGEKGKGPTGLAASCLPCGHYACQDWNAHQIAFLNDRVISYQQMRGIMD